MKKKLILFFVILGALAAVLGLVVTGERHKQSGANGGKLPVVASFYPLAEFARQIGGDKVTVTAMVKPGVEPHEYEPPPGDVAALHQSKVFIYNGAGLEPWAARLRPELTAAGLIVVEASHSLPLRSAAPDAGEGAGQDPHVWLDPVLAARQAEAIEAALVQADPANSGYYHERATQFKAQLAALDQDFRAGLANCSRHDVVTSHQAMNYVAARYGFRVQAIAGLSPDEEPSPQKLAETAQFARQHGVPVIFFETLVSPKLSDTIAREVGARTLVFNPLEGLTQEETGRGDNYLTIQRQNLNNLRIALDCK